MLKQRSAHNGPTWPQKAILGPSAGLLWALLGPSWGPSGAILRHYERNAASRRVLFTQSSAHNGPTWPQEAILGPSWGSLWDLLGPSWGPPGAIETFCMLPRDWPPGALYWPPVRGLNWRLGRDKGHRIQDIRARGFRHKSDIN